MDMDVDVSISLVMHISYGKVSITKKKVNIISHFRSLNMLVFYLCYLFVRCVFYYYYYYFLIFISWKLKVGVFAYTEVV